MRQALRLVVLWLGMGSLALVAAEGPTPAPGWLTLLWENEPLAHVFWDADFGEYLVFRTQLPEGCMLVLNKKLVEGDAERRISVAVPVPPKGEPPILELVCPWQSTQRLTLGYQWIKESPFFHVRIQQNDKFRPPLNVSTDKVMKASDYLTFQPVTEDIPIPPPAETITAALGVGFLSLQQTHFTDLSSTSLLVSAAYRLPRWGRWDASVAGEISALPLHTAGSSETIRWFAARADVARTLYDRGGWRWQGWAGVDAMSVLGYHDNVTAGFSRIYGAFLGPRWEFHRRQNWDLSADARFGIYNGDHTLPNFDNWVGDFSIRYRRRDAGRPPLFAEAAYRLGHLSYTSGTVDLKMPVLRIGAEW